MNNTWNRWIYKAWSPVYDLLFNSPLFRRARETVFQMADIPPGSRVLLVGVGTGADLPLLSRLNVQITAIDLSPDMIAQAQRKDPANTIHFMEMDAQQLRFPDGSFDVVIANLILSVVPDAGRCFSEMVRVARSQGKLVIFDKFVPHNGKLPTAVSILRPLIALLGTDIGRKFEEILAPYSTAVELRYDKSVMLGGMYRSIQLYRK